MNKIVNKILLAGYKFIPKLHLRLVCGAFAKHRERIQKFRETGDLNYIYKNELDNTCFAHDTIYSDSKDFAERTIPDKILKDRAYEIAIIPKYDGYQRGLASMVCKQISKVKANVNEVLAQELQKPVIIIFKRRKVYARFKRNIWAADLAEMGSLS